MANETKLLTKKWYEKRGVGQVITVFVALLLLCVIFGCINHNFVRPTNLRNLLREMSPILLIGIGQAYVLITANIDLSIGSVIGMSCMISASLMCAGVPPVLAVIIDLVCCLAIGFLNGVLVAKVKIPPFIATLGTMTMARGIAQLPNHNTDYIGVVIGDKAADAFSSVFYNGRILGLYSPVWLALLLWLVFNFYLSRTRSGRHIYAIGSNIDAARLSGVNVFVTTTKAYLVSSFCACTAGLITCAQTSQGTMDAGNMYETYAVIAAVVGGVSTMGGTGLLVGVIAGAGIWGVLQNGLQFANAPVAIRNIIIGVIVILSVALDIIVRAGKHTGKKGKALKTRN